MQTFVYIAKPNGDVTRYDTWNECVTAWRNMESGERNYSRVLTVDTRYHEITDVTRTMLRLIALEDMQSLLETG